MTTVPLHENRNLHAGRPAPGRSPWRGVAASFLAATFLTAACLPLLLATPAQARAPAPDEGPSAEPTRAPSEQKQRILFIDLKAVGVEETMAKTIAAIISARLSKQPDIEVISDEDMRRMVELEQDKIAVGCEDDESCLAELAAALGAESVLFGEAGKLGTSPWSPYLSSIPPKGRSWRASRSATATWGPSPMRWSALRIRSSPPPGSRARQLDQSRER